MNYRSTRSKNAATVSSATAIKNGMAPDGGLYMPEKIPTLTEEDLRVLAGLHYPERAAKILSLFLTDYTEEELLDDCRAAYADDRFPGGAAPLVQIDRQLSSLELWHGPTCAFKDMALQIMPRLLSRALRKTGEDRTALILVATSGDTGKAALEGYRDVPHVKILVFFPTGGVSRIQKAQMTTQEGNNVGVCGIYGNFDDAQSGVKKIFSDTAIASELDRRGYFLSSANSINWGRLAPQIAYYVSAYCDMLNDGRIRPGDKPDVVVPTGNFGNIFAAYLAKQMGLPLGKLVCASNRNDVLTEFLRTGTYNRLRDFHLTTSPSRDILISSNLERLLYTVCGSEKTAEYMCSLAKNGSYTVAEEEMAKIRQNFVGYCCDEAETALYLHDAFNNHGYLMDTHTAVAYGCAQKYLADSHSTAPLFIVSTASPYKFAPAVLADITGRTEEPQHPLEALARLSGTAIPAPLADLENKPVRFPDSIAPSEMAARVLAFAGE